MFGEILRKYNHKLCKYIREIYNSLKQRQKYRGLFIKAKKLNYFNEEFYKSQFEPNEKIGNPFLHYINIGAKMKKDPSVHFSTSWYLSTNDDIVGSSVNPLVHYMSHGMKEGRHPSPYAEFEKYKKIIIEGLSQETESKPFFPQDKERDILVFVVEDDEIKSVSEVREHLYKFINPFDASCVTEDCGLLPEGITNLSANSVKNYVKIFNNVSIVGGTRYIFDGKEVIGEEIWRYKNSENFKDRHLKGGIAKKFPDDIICISMKGSFAPRIKKGILLMHEYDDNYFHFLVEVATKIIQANYLDADIPFIVTDDLNDNIYKCIDILNLGKRRIIKLKRGYKVNIEELYYLQDSSDIPDIYDRKTKDEEFVLQPNLLRSVRDVVFDGLGITAPRFGTKLYLKRGSGRRSLLNEEEVEKVMVEAGFAIIQTGSLSFEIQVRMFNQADVVVSATGASLTNMMWCKKDTKAFILVSDHEHLSVDYWSKLCNVFEVNCCRVSGERSYNINGKYSIHDNFSIDTEVLKNNLIEQGVEL